MTQKFAEPSTPRRRALLTVLAMILFGCKATSIASVAGAAPSTDVYFWAPVGSGPFILTVIGGTYGSGYNVTAQRRTDWDGNDRYEGCDPSYVAYGFELTFENGVHYQVEYHNRFYTGWSDWTQNGDTEIELEP